MSYQSHRYVRPRARHTRRPHLQALEPRKLLSATIDQIAMALDLPQGVTVAYAGHRDAIGVYENYSVHGILGMPSGPDGDFLAMSTAHAHDAVRTTDAASKAATTRYRDLGLPGAADDFATISFTLNVPAAQFEQRLLIDFIYASDAATTEGGDFFDITVNGINIAATHAARVEAGGQYVTNERDPDIGETVPGFGIEIDTEYSDLLMATYTIPVGVTTLDIVISIADSGDAELDAWALVDNVRFEGTQVVYLDFDGQNVGSFFLDGTEFESAAFDANDFGLGSNFADVIRGDLETLFADFDVVFTDALPSSGEFMHVVIGGDTRDEVTIEDTKGNDWLTSELGDTPTFESFFNFLNFRNPNGTEATYGVADRIDLGNRRAGDMAVIFSEQISRDGLAYSHLVNTIAHYIGRNLGLRAEDNANTDSIMAEDILFRGDQFEDADNAFLGDGWGDLDALGQTQNAHAMLLDVLGASAGETALRNSWVDAAKLNQAHWTAVAPTTRDLFDARFVIIGDKHTRAVTTTADVWNEEQIIITDYAGQDPQIVITAASRNDGNHDYQTLGPRNLGQFTLVARDAQQSTIGLWNPSVPLIPFRGSAFLLQTQVDNSTIYFRNFEYDDVDGDVIKVTLNSRTGLFAVDEGDFGLIITLGETSATRDTLTVKVQKKSGGDGRATIGGILGSGVKKLTADKIDFSGTGIDLVNVTTAKFGSFMDGTDLNVRQDVDTSASFTFTTIADDSRLVFGRHTKKVKADSIDGGMLVFDEVDKIDSKAHINAERVDIHDGQGATIKAKENVLTGTWTIWGDDLESLKKLDIKGRAGDGFTLIANGRVFNIKVKGDLDALIDALAIKDLKVDGELSGHIILRHDGTEFDQSIRMIKVKTVARNLLFQALDYVKDIKLGAAIDSRFYVGWDFAITSGLPVDSGMLLDPEARIKDVKLTGTPLAAFEMENSVFSAPEFKSLKLGKVNGNNLGTPFGISAMTVDKIEYDTGTGKIKSKKDNWFFDNNTSDDFLLGLIT